ncbi:hypothetical protein Cgig2_031626 [Carnegiea gigantea]|uniref:Uncharacterized protein n=1 Tax=Carnegiea gigantea TaxID=171969 RepID=A0A9Q1QEK1_9CARY|nr:hypothetical protein Cgig2_031626 [Carnegiea gigantea]
MVESNATRAWSRRDKNPMTDLPKAHEVHDASESSQATLHSVGQRLLEWETYVTVDAWKNFMETTIDTLQHQALHKVHADLALSKTVSTPHATHSQRTTWFKVQQRTSRPMEEPLQKGCSPERLVTRERTHSPPACDHRLLGQEPARVDPQGIVMGIKGHPILKKPKPMVMMSKPRNEGRALISFLDDPLVVELKVASTLVHRIVVDRGSSANIIIWDCVKKLKHPRKDITPLAQYRNLEVNFLIVDVPTVYDIIIVRLTLYKVKAITVPYLSQIQYKADDGCVGKLYAE